MIAAKIPRLGVANPVPYCRYAMRFCALTQEILSRNQFCSVKLKSMDSSGEKKDLSEIKISGKTHFVGNILRVEKDVVRLPDGEQSTREWVRHPGGGGNLAVVG